MRPRPIHGGALQLLQRPPVRVVHPVRRRHRAGRLSLLDGRGTDSAARLGCIAVGFVAT